MNTLNPNKIPFYRNLIIAVSIVIPLVVGALFSIESVPGDLSFLPPLYAGFNATTAIFLIAALVFIKQGKTELHRLFVRMALMLSLLFLACYVAYHLTSDPTYFGDINHDSELSASEKLSVGNWRWIYFFILMSHIGLSMIVIPLVLFAYLRAWAGQFDSHKKIVRYAFPIWLYVAITGVIVYALISPYYK
ncbi:MAG: hypothetical protein RLZ10_1582 [Bacteroidota bacterium]|jgi:putative membrane protein